MEISPPVGIDSPLRSQVASVWSRDALNRGIWAFLALGFILRLVRYLLCFPLWDDEAFLAANFINADYADMLQPLQFFQVAPPLFLWFELSIVKLLGYSEYSLRLFPFLCGLGSLFLFASVSKKILQGLPLLFAVAIFAVSYYPIRFGSEVKPYASDLTAALILLWLALTWARRSHQTRWLWFFAAVTPVLMFLSYPATFVAAGSSICLLPLVWKNRNLKTFIAYGFLNLALLASLATVYWLTIRNQYDSTYNRAMKDFWAEAFPPLVDPVKLFLWFTQVHTGRTFAYPCGGEDGGSILTFVAFTTAIVWMLRNHRLQDLAILLSPLVVTLVAAAIKRYPYGGSGRITQHFVPSICLLAGLGVWRLIAITCAVGSQRRAALSVCCVLAIFGGGFLIRDIVHPYKKKRDLLPRELAREFWCESNTTERPVSVADDLREPFALHSLQALSAAQFLCNQYIQAPTTDRGISSTEWGHVPLRCVVFQDLTGEPAGEENWLKRMEQNYRIVDRVERFYYSGGSLKLPHTEVFYFKPRFNSDVQPLHFGNRSRSNFD